MKHSTNLLLVFSFFVISTALYAAGEVKINTDLTVEADGTIVSSGNATVWNDINVFPDATTRSGSNSPTMTIFKTNGSGSQGVLLNAFSASTEQELYFTIQLPHSYLEGSTLYPHVHWTPFTTDGTNYGVVWGLEYTIVNIGGTFGNTTIITGSTPIAAVTGLGQHVITPLTAITSPVSPNEFKISTVLVCRIFRKVADAADIYSGVAGLLGFDIHYESDMTGSRDQFTK